MSKTIIAPGQEVLAVDGPFNAVPYLNKNEGSIQLEDLPDFDIDWERPLNYLDFLGQIGMALDEEPPKSSVWDDPLDVHGEDFQKAQVDNLEKKLYFEPWYCRSVKPPEVITIGREGPLLKAPGVRGKDEGVAVNGDEYKAVARSAPDLALHVHANTKEANDKRPPSKKVDDETLENRAGRSMAHAMLSKKDELLELDRNLKIERSALSVVNRLATEDSPKITMGELDWYRQMAALSIHGAVRVSSAQWRYGTTVRWGINRAIVSAFHRGEPEVRANSLKNYTKWAGYYIDAKRGKIYQSLSLCKQVFLSNAHYLHTKDQDPEQ